eukprot:scaffold206129_cov36-Tisochrysis_lutea.AAC.2
MGGIRGLSEVDIGSSSLLACASPGWVSAPGGSHRVSATHLKARAFRSRVDHREASRVCCADIRGRVQVDHIARLK